MDFKFTFDDGSEAYLAHYGVKGMKWKNHVAQDKDQHMIRRTRMNKNIQKALSKSAKGTSAKRAKARVKAYFSSVAKRGRKNLRAKGTLVEDTGHGTKISYY